MPLITEAIVRASYNKNNKFFSCSKLDKFTPSAKELILDRGIEINFIEDIDKENIENKQFLNIEENSNRVESEYKYICKNTGGLLKEKPEHMTQLYDNVLVYKFDTRVELRGKLDSLQASFIEKFINLSGNEAYYEDFNDLIKFIKSILISEYTNEPLKNIFLLGLDCKGLREYSHNPKKYFNSEHLFGIDGSFNKKTIILNKLRAEVREVEILATKTFFKEGTIEREDIIKALNRLSSGVYIAMLRAEGGYYE